MKKGSIVLIIALFFQLTGLGQDLSTFAKQPFFKLGGNANFTFSSQSYLLSASLNPCIYGYSIPLFFSYSNEGAAYAHPFNQFSISPSFKWAKLFAGKTQMNLSPYSLNGHSFDGVGLELSPNFPLQLTVLYGRLKKKIDHVPDSNLSSNLPPNEYKRMGWGGKITYKQKKQSISFNYFRAEDQKNELTYPSHSPQQNTILGGDFHMQVLNKIKITGAVSLSEFKQEAFQTQASLYNLGLASKWEVGFEKIYFSYERISPNYQNLGAYYTQNDFENIVLTFHPSFKKMQISTNLGLQREDLRKERQSNSNRWVGSVALNMPLGSALQLQVNYSNFTTLTHVKPLTLQENLETPYLIIDTLSIRQISQQGQSSLTYQWKTKEHKTSYIANFQQSKESRQKTSSTYYYHSIDHTSTLFSKYNLSISAHLSAQQNQDKHILTGGPGMNLSSHFFDKKLKINIGSQYYISNKSETFINGRMYITYAIQKKHSFSASVSGQEKKNDASNRFLFQFNISYSYLFNL